jgi:hypothetical protein
LPFRLSRTVNLLASVNFQSGINMYEPRHKKPLPRRLFVRRLIGHAVASVSLIVASLCLGMIGYHYYEDLPWLDAFLNAAMLLGGMGPVDSPHTDAGKLFAGMYALYSGWVFLVAAGVLLAPALHRMQHLFHWNERET